jgi:hypothetical protein
VSRRVGLRWRLPLLAGLAGLAVLVVGSGGSAAQTQQGFGGSSSAFGARLSVTISKAPLVPNIVDGGGPLAQTTLDSLGTRIALASYPYPGDVVLNLPGLAAGLGPQLPGLVGALPGLVGANVPGLPPEVLALLAQVEVPGELVEPLVAGAPALPAYPFAAQADDLHPHAEVDLGVGKLTADAAAGDVRAEATSAPGASGTLLVPLSARSRVTEGDDGSVVAEATGTITGLRVGPLVLSNITSTARMARTADDHLEQSSSFRASGIQVGSLTLDLTPEGFEIGGTPVPAPIAATVNALLASAGLELKLLPEVVTPSAVVAGGVELIRQQDFGPLGSGSISVILGQSSARLDAAGAIPAAPPVPGSDAVAPAAFGSAGDGGTGSGSLGVATGTPERSTARGGDVLETTRTVAAEPFDATGLYLLLIAAAAVVIGAGPLLRILPHRPSTVSR